MQYQFTERSEYVKTIEFSNSLPLSNIQKIRFFKEEEISGNFSKKEFRYSYDNVTWSVWNTLSQQNIANIEFKNQPYFWIHIKYTRPSVTSANIQRWYLYYDSNTPTPSVTPADTSIDADTLKGEGPSYYLNRENQFGSFTGLEVLNVIDGSTIGVYSHREDTSLGTSFYFKRIGPLNDDIVVSETGGKILIGLNTDLFDSSVNQLYDYVDASLEKRDTSIEQLFSMYGYYDSSILLLNDWNAVQDSSIGFLTSWNISQDGSIVTLRNRIFVVESSIGNITLWNQYQDASIINLRSLLSKTDASVVRIDASMNTIFNTLVNIDSSIAYLNTVNIKQDASIVRIDSRIQLMDASISDIYKWQNAQDVSIINLRSLISKTDASIVRIDASVSNIYHRIFVQDASIVGLRLVNTAQDASIIALRQVNVTQDASILSLTQKNVLQDSSISLLNLINVRQDSSIASLTQRNVVQDSSISELRQANTVQDASISSLRQTNAAQDASILALKMKDASIDASLNALYTYVNLKNSQQDASITSIKQVNVVQDVSIISLRNNLLDISTLIINIDTSLKQANIVQDTSLKNLSRWNVVQDGSIVSIKNNILAIEASIALIKDDQVINIGDGSIHIYSQRDSSNNILLKTIKYIGPVVLREDSSTITIDSSIVKLYDTTLNVSTYMPYAVGGLTKGTSVGYIYKDTYTNIFDKLLFPTVDPCIGEPYHTFTFDSNPIVLCDSNIYINFYTTFNRGSIMVGEVFQNYRSGLPYEYDFTGLDISGNFGSSSLTYNFLNEPINVAIGTTTWTSRVKYNGGPQPQNNKGANVGTALDSSITSIKTLSIEGVWPIFATTSVINLLAQQSIVSMINSSEYIVTLVPETNGFKQRIDLPYQWVHSPGNNPITGIQTYSDVAHTWNWEGGSQSKSLEFWDVSTTTHNVTVEPFIDVSVNYISYTYNGTDRSTIKIKLIF